MSETINDDRRGGLREVPARLCRLIWRTASPKWSFNEATFERSAAAQDNPAPAAFAQAIMDVDRYSHTSHNPGGIHEHHRNP